MTMTTCCGTTPRDITIDLSPSELKFVYCNRCETRQWFRNGEPVELGTVKQDATARWSRKPVSV